MCMQQVEMASEFAWISVMVKRGASIGGARKIIKASWSETFRQLLCRYS